MGHSIVDAQLWVYFLIGITILVFVDLIALHGKTGAMSIRKATLQSIAWISVALIFNLWFGWQYGQEAGIQFLTGYLVEKSLSIDNLFVILLIFKSFQIAPHLQHRVLFWGIFGAIVMRGVLIVIGAGLLHRFHFIIYVFGLILIISGIKFLIGSDEVADVKDHWLVRFCKKWMPLTDRFHGEHFFVKENHLLKATPLFLALLVIEATDLVFAVDSIPAVLSITTDTFIAFSSNILAVLGLRALYFVIAEWIGKLRYLKPGLAAVLCFVGAKMLLVDVIKIPSTYSLIVIIFILLTAGISSWYVNKTQSAKES